MRSEIPQIQVITAIGEADLEDYVAQLLFSQGWSIIFRAFDWISLTDFMGSRSIELRTVVVYTTDISGFTSDSLLKFGSPTVSFISLDETPKSAHEIMQKIRTQLRLPMIQSTVSISQVSKNSPEIQEKQRSLILVTGSSGAPGKTKFALAIADYLSSTRKVTLVDIDFRSTPLQSYEPANNFSIVSLSPLEKPTQMPDLDKKELLIVDAGVLPPIREVVDDRRWVALLLNHILETSTHLVYVCQTTKQSLMQLDQFKKEITSLTKKIPVTYICISVGQSGELRKAQAAFTKLTVGEQSFILGQGKLGLQSDGFLDNFLASGKKKEIGTIASSLL